jgi:hypothetical protein
MTGSKYIVMEIRPNTSNVTISYGDKSSSKVLGFGKVVVTPDMSLVNVILVETIGYSSLFIPHLSTMGFTTFFDADFVVVMWIKNLKVVFVGYAKNFLYVVEFLEKPTTVTVCLIA